MMKKLFNKSSGYSALSSSPSPTELSSHTGSEEKAEDVVGARYAIKVAPLVGGWSLFRQSFGRQGGVFGGSESLVSYSQRVIL